MHDPEAVAQYADYPVNEVDLHARHSWLVNRRAWVEELMTDPDAYDAKIAGWWVWGISQWIGSGWCSSQARQLPSLGNRGMGVHAQTVHRKRPHLMSQKGVHAPSRQTPVLRGDSGASGQGIHASGFESKTGGLYACFEMLADRLRYVRVCCGDWARVLGPSVTEKIGMTAIFLDPPYGHAERQGGLYAHDHDVATDVANWARSNGENQMLRIALCGYEGEHDLPGWDMVHWKAAGGYGSQSTGRGRANASREVVWFSPACLNAPTLFDLILQDELVTS